MLASSQPAWPAVEQSYYAQGFLQEHTPAWLLHYRTLAAASATCKLLHDLVWSPAAASLWEVLCLAPAYPQLPASKLPALQRYIESHSLRAKVLCVAGSVGLDHLRAAVRHVTALDTLYTCCMCLPAEVDELGSAVSFSGAAPVSAAMHDCPAVPHVPASVTFLDLYLEADPAGAYHYHDQERIGSEWVVSPHNVLSRLVHLCHLCHLEQLILGLGDGWTLMSACTRHIVCGCVVRVCAPGARVPFCRVLF